MSQVYLGIGSNIGDRSFHIYTAIETLGQLLRHLVVAPLYETDPLDYLDQGAFLNTVVRGETTLSPKELLSVVADIENQGGRTREGSIPKGPRTIDIDILLYGEETIAFKTPDLTVPHPRMAKRLFVLQPLLDVAPDGLQDPRDGIPWKSKAALLADQVVLLYTRRNTKKPVDRS